MSCFMGYNPLVAKEVKITTWIKEFDGDSPVYPSFPNEGDCFVVFATDEDALTHNALSKKTYTNGDWADAEGGGGGDYPTFKLEGTYPDVVASCDKTFAECGAMLDGGVNVCLFDSSAVTGYPLMGGFMHWASDEKTSIYGSFYDEMGVTYLQNGTVLPQ